MDETPRRDAAARSEPHDATAEPAHVAVALAHHPVRVGGVRRRGKVRSAVGHRSGPVDGDVAVGEDQVRAGVRDVAGDGAAALEARDEVPRELQDVAEHRPVGVRREDRPASRHGVEPRPDHRELLRRERRNARRALGGAGRGEPLGRLEVALGAAACPLRGPLGRDGAGRRTARGEGGASGEADEDGQHPPGGGHDALRMRRLAGATRSAMSTPSARAASASSLTSHGVSPERRRETLDCGRSIRRASSAPLRRRIARRTRIPSEIAAEASGTRSAGGICMAGTICAQRVPMQASSMRGARVVSSDG